MTIPVIRRPLLRVAQNRIGFRRFLKFLFRFFIARIAVWVVLQRKFSVRALERAVIAVARNAQDFVIISFCDTHLESGSLRKPTSLPPLSPSPDAAAVL